MMKEYWHKPSGRAVSEATYVHLVELGRFSASEFEEAALTLAGIGCKRVSSDDDKPQRDEA